MGKNKPLVNATSISGFTWTPPLPTYTHTHTLYHHFKEPSLIYHYGCSAHRDQCSYKTYKCEFSSYPHAAHINQQCIPCQPNLIHILASLLQREPVVIKQDRYAELVKNTASTTAWHEGDDYRGPESEGKVPGQGEFQNHHRSTLIRGERMKLHHLKWNVHTVWFSVGSGKV